MKRILFLIVFVLLSIPILTEAKSPEDVPSGSFVPQDYPGPVLKGCGDGTISRGEECDPAATPNGCAPEQPCNSSTCKCFPIAQDQPQKEIKSRPMRIKKIQR
jgi:hypothetical protein